MAKEKEKKEKKREKKKKEKDKRENTRNGKWSEADGGIYHENYASLTKRLLGQPACFPYVKPAHMSVRSSDRKVLCIDLPMPVDRLATGNSVRDRTAVGRHLAKKAACSWLKMCFFKEKIRCFILNLPVMIGAIYRLAPITLQLV